MDCSDTRSVLVILLMKILFLDVDGVLNSYKTGGRYALTRSRVRRLAHIVSSTGCKIVLSSTWRKDPYALKRLRRVLKYRDIEIAAATPDLGKERGLDIQAWIVDNASSEPMKFAIVDDDSDMLDHQLPHFFQTDGDYGLTETIAYRIIEHLGRITHDRISPSTRPI